MGINREKFMNSVFEKTKTGKHSSALSFREFRMAPTVTSDLKTIFDSEAKAILSNCNTKIFLKPSETKKT